MYSLHFFRKSFLLFFLLSCQAQQTETSDIEKTTASIKETESTSSQPVIVGAEKIDVYLPLLSQKRVGIVGNQTSRVGTRHLVDTLLELGVDLVTVFSPEHGFRGDADAGEKVDSKKDEKTGLPIVSLYGKNKKPTASQLASIDIIVFDIQDVGARFYTYISTLHYVMEACAEQDIKLIVLDRPNPNGHIVDGPIRAKGFSSFVGMHPIPILHGMTIGEYALMINGEKWLNEGITCELEIITCDNYTHDKFYSLPIAPSPNLRSDASIALYPSLCLFEGTLLSVGRGTEQPFTVFGHPDLKSNADVYSYTFTPQPSYGAKNPKLNGEQCYGKNLNELGEKGLDSLRIDWLIETYNALQKEDFFITKNKWFDLLAGTDQLRKQIVAGKSEQEIRNSWMPELEAFKKVRSNYLKYD